MLAVVRPGRREGTSLFLPGAWTGWKEMAEGANSRRVLVLLILRVMKGWVMAVWSAWHLPQTSYSNLAALTNAPAVLTPETAPSLGEMVGAVTRPVLMVWGSWQSEQVELVGAWLGRLTGELVSWRLILLRSAATFEPASAPSTGAPEW